MVGWTKERSGPAPLEGRDARGHCRRGKGDRHVGHLRASAPVAYLHAEPEALPGDQTCGESRSGYVDVGGSGRPHERRRRIFPCFPNQTSLRRQLLQHIIFLSPSLLRRRHAMPGTFHNTDAEDGGFAWTNSTAKCGFFAKNDATGSVTGPAGSGVFGLTVCEDGVGVFGANNGTKGRGVHGNGPNVGVGGFSDAGSGVLGQRKRYRRVWYHRGIRQQCRLRYEYSPIPSALRAQPCRRRRRMGPHNGPGWKRSRWAGCTRPGRHRWANWNWSDCGTILWRCNRDWRRTTARGGRGGELCTSGRRSGPTGNGHGRRQQRQARALSDLLRSASDWNLLRSRFVASGNYSQQ